MSIGPVQAPTFEEPKGHDTPRDHAPQAAAVRTTGNATEVHLSASRQDHSKPDAKPAETNVQAEKIQVVRDLQDDNQIVVKYVDQAGNLVLQIPSSQVLNVARTIQEEFQHAAQTREDLTSTAPGKEKGR